ncbi:MAG: hypothetical protein P4L49_19490 [Desulfosporosinus sp.]|nr:hypothetical protein [Desulfosporosinus sp.]
MDKENKDFVRDDCMAIAKEPKTSIQQNTSNDHNRKISKAIKEVTSQHSKLLKKLAE